MTDISLFQWLDLLRSEDESERAAAHSALEDIGPPSPEDASRLASLLSDPNADVAYWGATLLGRMQAAAVAQAPALAATLLAAPSMAVRERCAWAIGKIGPAASAARPALEKVVTGDAPRLARLAREALALIECDAHSRTNP